MARIRFVLVGVDRYERSDVPSLSGCVNDVALVRRILKQCFGVPNEDIRVLVNERATKANILQRLRRVVATRKTVTSSASTSRAMDRRFAIETGTS